MIIKIYLYRIKFENLKKIKRFLNNFKNKLISR